MNSTELINYLANIIKIMRADSVISPHEESIFNEICKELKLSKKEINTAEKIAAEENFVLQPIGRFSDQIRNLEDMVLISLIDGKFENKEKELIIQFAKKIKTTQEQINLILQECKRRKEKNEISCICNKCNASISASGKFCPNCGTAIEEQKESTQLDFNYPKEGITIEFAESTSATFDMALKAASSAPNFQKCIRNKKTWYLANWSKSQFMNSLELADNLKGVKNRKIYVDGNLMEWNDIFGFSWCLKERQGAYKPLLYCFGNDNNQLNLWGCHQIRMAWNNWAEWFTFGNFKNNNTFVFDKERIWHNLQTNLQHVRFCPHIRHNLIEIIFKLLPNKATIEKYSGWKYRETYEKGPNCIKVKVNETGNGYSFANEFYSNGVQPVDYEVAKNILQVAFKKCSVQDINIKDIFK